MAVEQKLLDGGPEYNIAKRAEHASLGLTRSAESRAKQGDALRGRKRPLRDRQAISAAKRGKLPFPDAVEVMRRANTGRVLPAEQIAKQLATKAERGITPSATHLEQYNIAKRQRIEGIDPMTGLVVIELASQYEARLHGFSPSNLNSCLKGKLKTHGGLFWTRVL